MPATTALARVAAAILTVVTIAVGASLVAEWRATTNANHRLQAEVGSMKAQFDEQSARMDALASRVDRLTQAVLSARELPPERVPSGPATDAPPAPPSITSVQAKAAMALDDAVDRGIASHRWAAEDESAVQKLIANTPADEAVAALGRLAVAINRGDVTPARRP
jgi:hypothetical protein